MSEIFSQEIWLLAKAKLDISKKSGSIRGHKNDAFKERTIKQTGFGHGLKKNELLDLLSVDVIGLQHMK